MLRDYLTYYSQSGARVRGVREAKCAAIPQPTVRQINTRVRTLATPGTWDGTAGAGESRNGAPCSVPEAQPEGAPKGARQTPSPQRSETCVVSQSANHGARQGRRSLRSPRSPGSRGRALLVCKFRQVSYRWRAMDAATPLQRCGRLVLGQRRDGPAAARTRCLTTTAMTTGTASSERGDGGLVVAPREVQQRGSAAVLLVSCGRAVRGSAVEAVSRFRRVQVVRAAAGAAHQSLSKA